MIALIIILLYIVLRIYIKVLEIKEEQNPKWINYTKDTYKGGILNGNTVNIMIPIV